MSDAILAAIDAELEQLEARAARLRAAREALCGPGAPQADLYRLVPLAEAAEAAGLSKRTLERMKAAGELPEPVRAGGDGRPALWRRDALLPAVEPQAKRLMPGSAVAVAPANGSTASAADASLDPSLDRSWVLADEGPSPSEAPVAADVVAKLLRCLTPRQRRLVEIRYGLVPAPANTRHAGGPKTTSALATLDQAARALGVTESRASQIEEAAMRALRVAAARLAVVGAA